MNVDRRDFFKVLSAGVITATTSKTVLAETRQTIPADAVGILYDATLCIGCKSCEVGCQKNNEIPALYSEDGYTSNDPYSLTMNKIEVYRNGTGEKKDSAVDGFCFIKKEGIEHHIAHLKNTFCDTLLLEIVYCCVGGAKEER